LDAIFFTSTLQYYTCALLETRSLTAALTAELPTWDQNPWRPNVCDCSSAIHISEAIGLQKNTPFSKDLMDLEKALVVPSGDST
jgi:hypothetical protein